MIYFIAELGQNHQGDIKIAKKMIDTLKVVEYLTGEKVAAVKTAKRDIDTCLTEEQKKMPYTGPNSFGATYYEHRQALELSHDDFIELKNYAELNGFDFISSFTDKPSLDFLVDIGLKTLKVASQRIADIKLMEQAAAVPDITWLLSTGMSDIYAVKSLVACFKARRKHLFQCTSAYPCENNLLNLRVLKKYKKMFRGKVDGFGLSGHHVGIAPDLAAYMMGATMIERHFTLNRSWKGTDHAGSLGIDGIIKIIKYIKEIDESMGSYRKVVLAEEMPAIKKLRGDLENQG